VDGQRQDPAALPPGKRVGTRFIGGWVPGPVWMGAENLAPTGIRFTDRTASSESLWKVALNLHLIGVDI